MQKIFAEHLATHDAQEGLWRVEQIVKSGKRVALMCFEADYRECHRTLVADALSERVPIEVSHLQALPE
jgi:uncharacterized protein (DUF488 family)